MSSQVTLSPDNVSADLYNNYEKYGLTKDDVECLKKAGTKASRWIAFGFTFGTGVAFLYARKRFRKLNLGPIIDPTTRKIRMESFGPFMVNYAMIPTAGSIFGTSAGYSLGTSSALSALNETGNRDKIMKALKDAYTQNNPRIQGQGRPQHDQQQQGQQDQMGGGEQQNYNESSPWSNNQTFTSDTDAFSFGNGKDDASSSSSSDQSATSSQSNSSRWDQLRNQSPSSSSSWDKIRHPGYNNSSSSSSSSSSFSSAPSQQPTTATLDSSRVNQDEFDKLLDRERNLGLEQQQNTNTNTPDSNSVNVEASRIAQDEFNKVIEKEREVASGESQRGKKSSW